ncbi:MAG TPA: YkgJ family cysteine cluster protein, partial [Gammaproteobacteria bacterium]|nr:YkgJ family cysteine cluster protein [Gammaproteobacteria bacterium]
MPDIKNLDKESPIPDSPVIPNQLPGDAVIQFRCHKDIDCFNACCKNIDIMLTPYDILRLKKRLGITSTEFLRLYTEPFEFGKNSVAGVKYKPKEGTTECQFVTEAGCSVYEDRPTACRYYPVGLLSTRRQDENFDRASYALVREDHCHGHFEDRKLTIDEYRKEQGLEEYDEHGRAWRQLILKVKSAGPAIGNMSKTSLRFFFMACYDLDRFREFIRSTGFSTTYDIDQPTMDELLGDDMALLRFGDRMIRQIMYGEETIALKHDALEQHLARRGARKSTEH